MTPVYLEHELDRITSSDEHSTLDVQFAWLKGTTDFGAANAYQLPPMWLIDGNVAAGRFRWDMSAERERLVARNADIVTLSDIAFCSTSYGNRFFGHHLVDDLPLAIAASKFGEPRYSNRPGELPVNIRAYRAVCGVDHPNLWTARISNCWVFQDAYLNDSKVERIQQMRSSIASHWGPGRGYDRVYIRRGPNGAQRAPDNESELIALLDANGWAIIDPESMTTEDVVRSLLDAQVITGVEGSQMAHAIMAARAGAGVVSLIPPNRFNLLFKDFYDRLGINFGFHVGSSTESGWKIDIDGAQIVLERVAKRASA